MYFSAEFCRIRLKLFSRETIFKTKNIFYEFKDLKAIIVDIMWIFEDRPLFDISFYAQYIQNCKCGLHVNLGCG